MENKNPFEGSELTSILVVSNISVSKKFYVDVLGAEIFREYGGSSLVLKFLGNWILLVTGGEPTEDKPDIEFSADTPNTKVDHSFTIRVKNCRRSYDLLVEKGVEFLTPPYDWGEEIRCFFRDPDGHLFEISEYKG